MTARRVHVPVRVVAWAAAECARQRSGELSVAWMVEGWAYAMAHRSRPPTYGDVLLLGRLVEPRKAATGTRRYDVQVGTNVKMPWEHVDDALRRLVSAQPIPDPVVAFPLRPEQGERAQDYAARCDAWYRDYEDVHPFADGNGRTGSLLFNWHMRSLPEPVHPPDFADPRAYWARTPRRKRLYEAT